MGLTKCKACGHEVSKNAAKCPSCGEPLKRKPLGCGGAIAFVFLFVVILVAIGSINAPDSGYSKTATTPPARTAAKPQVQPEPKIPGDQWKYASFDDDMSGSKYHLASVTSSNRVNFQFPYSGLQRGTLTLRTHPRHGKDLMFSIEQGQILCRTYDPCRILARFDDGGPTTFSALGAADNSTETIFIKPYFGFVEQMLKSQTVRIEVPFYQEGQQVFTFDVSAFNQDKYLPAK